MSRIKGKDAITRSLRRVLIRLHHYGRQRARTRPDVLWAARLIAALTALLDDATKTSEGSTRPANRRWTARSYLVLEKARIADARQQQADPNDRDADWIRGRE